VIPAMLDCLCRIYAAAVGAAIADAPREAAIANSATPGAASLTAATEVAASSAEAVWHYLSLSVFVSIFLSLSCYLSLSSPHGLGPCTMGDVAIIAEPMSMPTNVPRPPGDVPVLVCITIAQLCTVNRGSRAATRN
jgi:hypothetical protein